MLLNEENIIKMSKDKNEPKWMLDIRLNALKEFIRRPTPKWQIPSLDEVDFNSFEFYNPKDIKARDWNDVPKDIRDIYDKMGIPEAEKKVLGGSIAQYESSSIYANIKKEWEDKGVIFLGLDEALQKHPDIVKAHFGKCVPFNDNKLSALHYAVWSGGSFLYVPKNVKVNQIMQTFFYMNKLREGQFEHTLIVAEKGSELHYAEGCTAPKYDDNALHSAVVEIFVKEDSKVRYTTVQNWSKNIYNLNTKRAIVQKNAFMEWVGGSLGAKVSMLYPCSVLVGEGARASHLTITLATDGSIKEGGAKVIHAAKNTHSNIISKGVNIGSGYGVYRGLVRFAKGAINSSSNVKCDSLMLGEKSKSDTFPHVDMQETKNITFNHEAFTGKITEEQLEYAMSRGITKNDAMMLYVQGFIKPVISEIPLEYAVELNRFIKLQLDETVG